MIPNFTKHENQVCGLKKKLKVSAQKSGSGQAQARMHWKQSLS